MSRSNRKKKHFMDDQVSLMKGIRKPAIKKGGAMKEKRPKKWDWRNWGDEIEKDEESL